MKLIDLELYEHNGNKEKPFFDTVDVTVSSLEIIYIRESKYPVAKASNLKSEILFSNGSLYYSNICPTQLKEIIQFEMVQWDRESENIKQALENEDHKKENSKPIDLGDNFTT